jgi:squalene synthase HpnC
LYPGDKNSSPQSLHPAENAIDHPTWIESVGSAPGVTTTPAVDRVVVRRQERAENFPVALRILPARLRAQLRAVYALARRIDDAGDDPAATPHERLARLDALADEVRATHAGTALEQPFLDLVEANRLDQRTSRYPTFADLRDYCRLSADPVGRIVLAVFGVDDGETVVRSDLVCTALQILEHCQDVAEDRRDRDRIYLPLEDLERFGVAAANLDANRASGALRRLLAFEVDRAERLLDDGAPIVGGLHGWARVAVAGYVGGGRATVEAIRRADHDVLRTTPHARKRDVARHAIRLLGGRP